MNIKERITEIFAQEAQAISSIPVTDEYERAVNLLKDCNGNNIHGKGWICLVARSCRG